MKVYDKLVRDMIPEIIEASGNKCDVEVVSDEVVLEYLYKKPLLTVDIRSLVKRLRSY